VAHISLQGSILSRLVAARHLIDMSGRAPTSSTPSQVVSQQLLVMHDAAELVFLALSAQKGIVVKGKDGSAVREPSFMLIAEHLIEALTSDAELSKRGKIQILQDLNEARKLFKHQGLLVDSSSSAHLFSDSLSVLDDLCIDFIGRRLSEIDQTSSVADPEIAALLRSASYLMEAGQFEESLKETARALSNAIWNSKSLQNSSVGIPDSEQALLLSGRGIDPASFLLLQQLLPTLHSPNGEPKWELRAFGHPANWTFENAQFCIATAANVISKLQVIPSQPRAIDFYRRYEDVASVLDDLPEAYWSHGSFLGSGSYGKEPLELRQGDEISGRITGRMGLGVDLGQETLLSLEYADWLVIQYAATARLPPPEYDLQTYNIWIKRENVTIRYRNDRLWQAILDQQELDESREDN
jgi:hypothetical protein